MSDDRDQAAQGGFRRDPETGFVYYSSEWLSDEQENEDAE